MDTLASTLQVPISNIIINKGLFPLGGTAEKMFFLPPKSLSSIFPIPVSTWRRRERDGFQGQLFLLRQDLDRSPKRSKWETAAVLPHQNRFALG